MNWKGLGFDGTGVGQNFQQAVVEPLRNLAGITIDPSSIIGGVLGPGSISDKVTGAYRKYLLKAKTLQDLSTDPAEGPRCRDAGAAHQLGLRKQRRGDAEARRCEPSRTE